jgi:hypothetical protein
MFRLSYPNPGQLSTKPLSHVSCTDTGKLICADSSNPDCISLMDVVNADIAGAIYLSVQLFVNIVISVALCLKMVRMEATLVEHYLISSVFSINRIIRSWPLFSISA